MEIVRHVILESVGDTEADWSSGLHSSSTLPRFTYGEFDRLTRLDASLPEVEIEVRRELRKQMKALLDENPDLDQGLFQRTSEKVTARFSRRNRR
jgi:hypothetical protein